MKKTLVFIVLILTGLALPMPGKVSADRLTVVASVFPLFDFAREVAGSSAEVKLLLPPGVDPHSWEPKPSDIVGLSKADIFLYTSDEMEPWAGKIVSAVAGQHLSIVRIMDSLGLTRTDPHFWLDLSLSARTVEIIGELMADRDQENRGIYVSRAKTYSGKLRDLDRRYLAGLAHCASKQLVTGGHAAYGYLSRRYGLVQVSVYGLSPEAEPSPRHLAEIVKLIRKNGVKTVFSEKLMNPEMARVLSSETGTKVLVLDPAGNLSADQWKQGTTFIEIMNRNLDALRMGLACE